MSRAPNTLPARGGGSPAEPPRTLTEQAYRALEERIVTLRYAPGVFLSEHAIAAEIGLTR